jgi:hypothetical protein
MRIYIVLASLLFISACNKTEITSELEKEKNHPLLKIDPKLNDGIQFKTFINIIDSKDCNSLKLILYDRFSIGLGEGNLAEFMKHNKYLESKYQFSVCDMFFDTDILQTRIALLDETNEKQKYYKSPYELLSRSKEINVHAYGIVRPNGDLEVGVAFFGVRVNRADYKSHDVSFMFRCPRGYLEKCYLSYMGL